MSPPNHKFNRYFRAFLLKQTDRKKRAKLRHLANKTSCVYPSLNIHFDRIAKNANTYMYMALDQTSLGLNKPRNRAEVRSAIQAPIDLPLHMFPSFYRFRHLVVIRSPFSRTLSAYLNKISLGPAAVFGAFDGFGTRDPVGFKTFLRGLKQNGAIYRNRHFWPQIDHMLS